MKFLSVLVLIFSLPASVLKADTVGRGFSNEQELGVAAPTDYATRLSYIRLKASGRDSQSFGDFQIVARHYFEEILAQHQYLGTSRVKTLARHLVRNGFVDFDFNLATAHRISEIDQVYPSAAGYDCRSGLIRVNLAAPPGQIFSSFVHQASHLLFDVSTEPQDAYQRSTAIADEVLATLAGSLVEHQSLPNQWPNSPFGKLEGIDYLLKMATGVSSSIQSPPFSVFREFPSQLLLKLDSNPFVNPLLDVLKRSEKNSGTYLTLKIAEMVFGEPISELEANRTLATLILRYLTHSYSNSPTSLGIHPLHQFELELSEKEWLALLQHRLPQRPGFSSLYCRNLWIPVPGLAYQKHWHRGQVTIKRLIPNQMLIKSSPGKRGKPSTTGENGSGVKNRASDVPPKILKLEVEERPATPKIPPPKKIEGSGILPHENG